MTSLPIPKTQEEQDDLIQYVKNPLDQDKVPKLPLPAPDLIEFSEDGQMSLNLHPGQMRAWESKKRFVNVLAGTQSGKTALGPPWLLAEMLRKGPGDVSSQTWRSVRPSSGPFSADQAPPQGGCRLGLLDRFRSA